MAFRILILLAFISVIVAYSTGGVPLSKTFINGLSTNLISEFLGAALIAFFIERILEKRQVSDKNKVKGFAYKRIMWQLSSLFDNLILVVSEQNPSGINRNAKSLRELFNDNYFEELKSVNLNANTKHIFPSQPWHMIIGKSAFFLKSSIETSIGLYGNSLDVQDLKLIDKVYANTNLNLLIKISEIENLPIPGAGGFVNSPFSTKHLMEPFQVFIFDCIKLSEECEKRCEEKIFSLRFRQRPMSA